MVGGGGNSGMKVNGLLRLEELMTGMDEYGFLVRGGECCSSLLPLGLKELG